MVNISGFWAHGFVHPWYHGFLVHGIACNGAYKRLGILHCNAGVEVSGEGSLGRIGQGFGQWLMKFHWLGFSPDLGFSWLNICVNVYDLLLASFMFISLSKFFIISAVNF